MTSTRKNSSPYNPQQSPHTRQFGYCKKTLRHLEGPFSLENIKNFSKNPKKLPTISTSEKVNMTNSAGKINYYFLAIGNETKNPKKNN